MRHRESTSTLLVLPLLLLGALPCLAVDTGSEFPPVTRGERVLAAAQQALKSGGWRAKGQTLLSAWENVAPDDEEMDVVAMELLGYARYYTAYNTGLLEPCTADQLARLSRKCREEKEFWGLKLFAEEYLRLAPHGQDAPEMTNLAALAHALLDIDTEPALALWDEVVSRWPDSTEAIEARVYAEAIRGPQSIAALEAAYRIGYMQSRDLGNPYNALHSDMRVLKAADQDFFKEYLASPDVLPSEKAELLYLVLFHAHQAAKYKKVPELAAQIFDLVGYEPLVAEKAAFSTGLSYLLRLMYDEAAEYLEAFLQAYPESRDAPRASLHCAQAYDRSRRKQKAFIQYVLTEELYPGTEEAKEAVICYESMLKHHRERILVSNVSEAKAVRLAQLRRPIRPETVWEARPIPDFKPAVAGSPQDSTATTVGKAGRDRRFVRLASILAGKSASQ